DPRGARGMEAFHAKYGEKAAFNISGIANMGINTIYQLYEMAQSGDPGLEIADKVLMIPDLLEYMLCGGISTEYTNATTMQMLDSQTGKWSKEILSMMGLPDSLFTDIQISGDVKGELLPYIQQETGLKNRPKIYCVGSHDTASAVASIPAVTDQYAFISSGTWSLMGVVSDNAIINDTVYNSRLSNEGTITGAFRPLKNIMGLWIIQNCKRQWDREQLCNWDDLVQMAKQTPAFRSFINVNANDFFDGDNMPQKIQAYCKATGQQVPETKGEITRVVYESLAMSYRQTFISLEELKGRHIDVLHIVGGGSKNSLLNQFTADAIDREVIAGPGEATAIGNLLVQVKASGELKDLAEMRQVIRDSFDVQSFEPKEAAAWAEQYDRYLKITRQ
ncbi:MAG: FGGY-family carbohydrate kinase, partial [Eubacteriales bacterium]